MSFYLNLLWEMTKKNIGTFFKKKFNLALYSHSVMRKQAKAKPRNTKSNSFIIPVYLGEGEKDKISKTKILKT